MQFLRANTAVDVLIGPFVDATDGATAEITLTLDVELSKLGQALANKTEATAPTHDAAGTIDGHYNCMLDATDTNTEGTLVLLAFDSEALIVRHEYMVLSEAAWDSMFLANDTGLMHVDVAGIDANVVTATAINADAVTAAKLAADVATEIRDAILSDSTAFAGANIDAAVTSRSSHSATDVTRAIQPQINTAFPDIEFLVVLTSDHVTPATGLTVTGERSIDGGAFAAVTGTIAEVSDGIYQFDASAADMNGSIITFRFSSATADDVFLTLKTTT